MLTTELSKLAQVVEAIRAKEHPQMDKAFVDAVLQAEAGAAGEDSAALQAIREALDAALERAAH
jgi:hypothetical protein